MIDVNDNKIPVLAAPLQGVTDNVWRMAQHIVFGGVDAYYAPFMRVDHGKVRNKDLRDVDPERNEGILLIPQILACQPEHALMMVTALKTMGYRRIDINMGCPFPPIALHRKGSGMLPYPDLVEELFTALASVEDVEYSVKMRLGWDSNNQWRDILPMMDILKPVNIAIHPRTGKQQYKGELDFAQFEALLAASPWPVVYNGNMRTIQDIEQVTRRYPTLAAVMVGSGLAANPGMFTPGASPDEYRRFHDLLVEGYTEQLNGGEAQLVRHLQDIWQTFLPGTAHKLFKAIRKSRTIDQYETAAYNGDGETYSITGFVNGVSGTIKASYKFTKGSFVLSPQYAGMYGSSYYIWLLAYSSTEGLSWDPDIQFKGKNSATTPLKITFSASGWQTIWAGAFEADPPTGDSYAGYLQQYTDPLVFERVE